MALSTPFFIKSEQTFFYRLITVLLILEHEIIITVQLLACNEINEFGKKHWQTSGIAVILLSNRLTSIQLI